jgi:hypothetical protein
MESDQEYDAFTISNLLSVLKTDDSAVPPIMFNQMRKDQQRKNNLLYFKTPFVLNTQVTRAQVKESPYGKSIWHHCKPINNSLYKLIAGINNGLENMMFSGTKITEMPLRIYYNSADDTLLHFSNISSISNAMISALDVTDDEINQKHQPITIQDKIGNTLTVLQKGPYEATWTVKGIRLKQEITETGPKTSVNLIYYPRNFIVKKVDLLTIIDAQGKSVEVRPVTLNSEESLPDAPVEFSMKSNLSSQSFNMQPIVNQRQRNDGFDRAPVEYGPKKLRYDPTSY